MAKSLFTMLLPACCGALLSMPALAQPRQSPAPCENKGVHNALDFAVGSWDIVVNGDAVAWIILEKDGRNCLIREQYGVPINGQTGAGIDYWDEGDNIWRRILVTSVGTIETFEGFQVGERFIWNGREERLNGETVLERVEMWAEGDNVRNDIYQSTDGGITWVLAGSEKRVRREGDEG